MSNPILKHNFHTHTARCKHARGDVDDYCRMAVEKGMHTLGFSDHTCLPDDRWISHRMHHAELAGYVAAIDAARDKFPSLRVVKGMECEYVPEFHAFYEDELFGTYGFEYLIGAAHFYPPAYANRAPGAGSWKSVYGADGSAEMLCAYTDYLIQLIQTGLFSFIAHPDLFGVSYPKWDETAGTCCRAILEAAQECGVGLEINALGLKKIAGKKPNNPFPMYPWLPFWEMAQDYDIQVIINSDAHRPADLQQMMLNAAQIQQRFGLNLMQPDDVARERIV